MDLGAGGFPNRTYVGKGTTVADVQKELAALREVVKAAARLRRQTDGREVFENMNAIYDAARAKVTLP